MSSEKIAFCDLAVSGVQQLQAYQPGKPVEELQRELGLSEIIKLASNENPLGPGPDVLKAIDSALPELSRYPDGNGFELKKALSSKYGVDINGITLGNGSNDILEIVSRTFCQAVSDNHQDEVIFSQHAFAVYPIVTQAVGAKAVVIPAKDWGHDLDAMRLAITENTKLIFIANPNNPTGTWIDEATLTAFLDTVPVEVIVVLDEAYYEFAAHTEYGAEGYPNGCKLLSRYPNLIVTRTFSKAYGLAGLRVGYSLSNAEIADLLNRVRQPFNVNSLAQVAACAALQDKDYLEKSITLNAHGMQQLEDAFSSLGLPYIPSVGNFICVDVQQDAAKVYQLLLEKGVIVRPVANYEMPDYLRISIGTESENATFIKALTDIVKK